MTHPKDSFDKRNSGLSLLNKLLRPWLHLYKHASDINQLIYLYELRNDDDIIISYILIPKRFNTNFKSLNC